MRLIDADELMEHAGRDKLDSRELIMQMINNAPTVMDDSDTVKKNLLGALEYERKLNNEVLGRLDAYRDCLNTVVKALIDRAARD